MQNHLYELHNKHYTASSERPKYAALPQCIKVDQLLKTASHSLRCVSSVGDEGVDEELVPVSSCNVQWCVSILIFTVYLSTFRKTQTKHLADEKQFWVYCPV